MKIPETENQFALYHIKKRPLTLHISRYTPNENHSCPKAVKVTETLPDPCSYCQQDEKLPERAQVLIITL